MIWIPGIWFTAWSTVIMNMVQKDTLKVAASRPPVHSVSKCRACLFRTEKRNTWEKPRRACTELTEVALHNWSPFLVLSSLATPFSLQSALCNQGLHLQTWENKEDWSRPLTSGAHSSQSPTLVWLSQSYAGTDPFHSPTHPISLKTAFALEHGWAAWKNLPNN